PLTFSQVRLTSLALSLRQAPSTKPFWLGPHPMSVGWEPGTVRPSWHPALRTNHFLDNQGLFREVHHEYNRWTLCAPLKVPARYRSRADGRYRPRSGCMLPIGGEA